MTFYKVEILWKPGDETIQKSKHVFSTAREVSEYLKSVRSEIDRFQVVRNTEIDVTEEF